jgi:hypothetical protein
MTNINKKYWRYNTYLNSEDLKKWMASRPKHLKDEHKPKSLCNNKENQNARTTMNTFKWWIIA